MACRTAGSAPASRSVTRRMAPGERAPLSSSIALSAGLGAIAIAAMMCTQITADWAASEFIVPFLLAGCNKLVDHGLSAIAEIAELRFPQNQCIGIGHGISIFKTQHAVFAQQ